MIIWLASYPRSGNTLLRIMLKEVFGCKTYEKSYRPPALATWTRAIHEVSGMVHLEGEWPQKYARLRESPEMCLVKTHHAPEDSERAVYIARNGFASIISYHSYLRELRQKDFSLEDVILGKPVFGSWGYHLDIWQPLTRPNTLLLTYEDLVQKPEEQIAKLSEFCGLRPQKPWVNEFDKLHALNPRFFRKGQISEASDEFSESQRQMFWALHGDWMRLLGYATDIDSPKAMAQLRRWLVDHAQSPLAEELDSKMRPSSLRQMIGRTFRNSSVKERAFAGPPIKNGPSVL